MNDDDYDDAAVDDDDDDDELIWLTRSKCFALNKQRNCEIIILRESTVSDIIQQRDAVAPKSTKCLQTSNYNDDSYVPMALASVQCYGYRRCWDGSYRPTNLSTGCTSRVQWSRDVKRQGRDNGWVIELLIPCRLSPREYVNITL